MALEHLQVPVRKKIGLSCGRSMSVQLSLSSAENRARSRAALAECLTGKAVLLLFDRYHIGEGLIGLHRYDYSPLLASI